MDHGDGIGLRIKRDIFLRTRFAKCHYGLMRWEKDTSLSIANMLWNQYLLTLGFRRCLMKTYAGIDLHSSNSFIGIINEKDKRLYSKRHKNQIEVIVKVLKPFKAKPQGHCGGIDVQLVLAGGWAARKRL